MFLAGFSNVFNCVNDHSYFFVKEEGDNDKYNSNKRTGSSFRGMLFLPLCNPLDSFRYAAALASLCSIPTMVGM